MSGSSRGRSLCIVGFLSCLARTAAGDDAKSAVEKARGAIEEQRYDDARAATKDDLASPRGAARAPALEIHAVSYLLEGRPAEAEPFVHALYEIAPAFELADPSLPPRVTSAFAAEAGKFHARRVTLAFTRAAEGDGFFVEASQRGTRIALSCRENAPATAPFQLIKLSASTPTRARFDLLGHRASACFATAFDEENLPVGRLGSEGNPIVLEPPTPKPDTGVLGRWWFWTAVGAAVVGGTAIAIVAAEKSPRQVSAPDADLTVSARSLRF